MKTSVFDFIWSNTLREHLSTQVLEPAIECLLIVNSENCSIEQKLEAMKERYDTYSSEDFKKGRYWLCNANDFKTVLKKSIDEKEELLEKMNEVNADFVFTIIDKVSKRSNKCAYRSLASAMATIRTEDDKKRKIIVRSELDNSESYTQIMLHINEYAIPYDVRNNYSFEDDNQDLQFAHFSIPHCFKKGDIIKWNYDNSFAVVTDILEPVNGVCICFSEMKIQCITIETNALNCNETLFRQEAYPLLDVEYCSPDDISKCNKDLLKLSEFMKKGYDTVDCLELSGHFRLPFDNIQDFNSFQGFYF